MAKIKIEMELAVVQEAIAAKVAPAVEEIIAAHYDLKAMIAEELVKDYAPSENERYGLQSLMMLRALSYGTADMRGRSLIEALIRDAIKTAAKAYIDQTVDDRRAAIEAAFREMMRKSPDRLVNAFVDLIEDADISLDLSATLAVKEPEREDYGRDC